MFLAVLAACNLVVAAMLASGALFVALLNVVAACALAYCAFTGEK